MTQIKETINTKDAAETGIGPTFLVAVEQSFPAEQRIIDDSLALRIMPRVYQWMVKIFQIPILRNWMIKTTENALTGGWSAFLVRKRYIDDRLIEAVTQNRVDAVVNLGAGYDTRLYRFPALQNIPAWEVDQAVNIEGKRKNLQKALGAIPPHVKLVSINFIEQNIGDVLSKNGYSGDEKTFFIWEAVTQYLTEAAIRKTFEFFAKAPSGSQLTFTYIRRDFIEGKNLYGQEKAYKEYITKSQMWHFGFDPEHLGDFLKEYGWNLVEDLSYKELNNRYVKPTGRELASMEVERMAFAEKL